MKLKAKYRKGDFVVIDKMFGVTVNPAGSMEKLEKARVAEVVEVNLTSTGPTYRLQVVGKPDLKFIACFWEEDILGPYDI